MAMTLDIDGRLMRVVLAGEPGAHVAASLVWGPGAGDSQTIAIPALSSEYKKFPLKFTAQANNADGRLEIVGTGSGKRKQSNPRATHSPP